jgi:AbrB family looped-hinge helix DNA binding protein
MKSTVTVSSRGQITLPSWFRKKMGIENGGVVRVEELNGKIVLTPAIVTEVEMYSDEQIKTWAEEDRFQPGEKEALLDKLKRSKTKKKE